MGMFDFRAAPAGAQSRFTWLTAAIFLFALVATISFAIFTNLAWDDWYITFRASKNLALGNGFTFTMGELVHSFTSPLGALLPAFMSWIGGGQADDGALWLFRGANAIVLALAAVLMARVATLWKLAPWFLVILLGMIVLDAKLLANSINGMETAMLVFFLFLSLCGYQAAESRARIVILGLAWGGMMWTRPDGCIYIAALSAGYWLFNPPERGVTRIGMVREFFLAGLLAAAIYGPWLIWAWSYYGSFVPHTIIAKGLSKSSTTLDPQLIKQVARFLLARMGSWNGTFVPPYGITFGGWPAPLVIASTFMAWLAAMVWILPPVRAVTRALSFATLVAQFYLTFGMEFPFPWYYPPVMALTICVLVLLLQQVATWGGARSGEAWRHLAVAATRGVALAGLVGTIAVTAAAAGQLRQFQTIIYDGNYRPVGLWLRDNASSPRDTVFLEPLGYIGFFSNLKMYDYPGLSSEEVIAARKRFPVTQLSDRAIFADLIPYMRPDWLVLRPREMALIDKRDRRILDGMYHPVKTFDVSREVKSIPKLFGRPWFELDQTFVVFRRGPAAVGILPMEAKTSPPRQSATSLDGPGKAGAAMPPAT